MTKFCCEDMERNIEYRCDIGHDIFECPDNLLFYGNNYDEYGLIIHDGGTSYIKIYYCPFCGQKLPLSKRDAWFDELCKLGYKSPFSEEIPEEFKSDEWWRKRGL